jgi:hypothetical protein
LLNQVPGAQVVSLYKITSSVAQYQNPIQVVIPIDIPFSGAVNDYVTELYRWDGSSYTTLRIDKGATNFLYEPIRLAAGGDTFVAVRAPISAVITACTARAGVFNGVYCALPFDSVANSAAVAPGNTRARALDQYKMVSFNVGNAGQSGPYNAPFYCGSLSSTDVAESAYVFKLCSYAIERRVRETLRQDGIAGQIDLLALQELWNNDCSTSLDAFVSRRILVMNSGYVNTDNGDKVCAAPTTTPGQTKQIERLVPTSIFDYHCSPIRSFPSSPRLSKRKTNGYECIAIRKQHFEFTDAEFNIPTIQPTCPGETQSSTVYYEGSDTGFQVERVRLKGALGPVTDATFDFINTHMIGVNRDVCRKAQLDALYKSYRVGINPKPVRILLVGDFNTSAFPLFLDIASTYLNQTVNSLLTSVDAPIGVKMGYFISDPLDITTTFSGIQSGFDHVITNFADSTVPLPSTGCIRGNIVIGTDHKRTLCTLTGFDSGKVRAGIQVLDLAAIDPQLMPWTGGTVAVSRRGVVLTYAKTTLVTTTYFTAGLASNVPNVFYYTACSLSGTKTKVGTVPSGGNLSNGIFQFSVILPNCL